MKNVIKGIIILIVIVIISLVISSWAGNTYNRMTYQSGTYIDAASLVGFPLVYVFLLPLVFRAFGDAKKYWWIGILLIPAAIFELYFDWQHIYIPILLGLVGWLVGYLIAKLIPKT